MPPLERLLPGSVGLLLCLAAAGWATVQLALALLAKGWSQTSAVVTGSRVEERRTRNGLGGKLRITYQWDEAGRARVGERVFFGDGLEGNLDACRALAAKYPVGARVTVFHAGGQSCLEPRAGLRVWLLAPFGWVMAGLIARAVLFGEG